MKTLEDRIAEMEAELQLMKVEAAKKKFRVQKAVFQIMHSYYSQNGMDMHEQELREYETKSKARFKVISHDPVKDEDLGWNGKARFVVKMLLSYTAKGAKESDLPRIMTYACRSDEPENTARLGPWVFLNETRTINVEEEEAC